MSAKDLPCEERIKVLREAYTTGLTAQLARNQELVAEARRVGAVNVELTEVLAALTKTFVQVVSVMLDAVPGKTFTFRVEDLMRLDGAEIETHEVDGDGATVYHLKT